MLNHKICDFCNKPAKHTFKADEGWMFLCDEHFTDRLPPFPKKRVGKGKYRNFMYGRWVTLQYVGNRKINLKKVEGVKVVWKVTEDKPLKMYSMPFSKLEKLKKKYGKDIPMQFYDLKTIKTWYWDGYFEGGG